MRSPAIPIALAGITVVCGTTVSSRSDTLDGKLSSGITLPTAPLAGDADARSVATNPGALAFVDGAELALALDLEDPLVAAAAGGAGVYAAAATSGGGILPRSGFGVGLEWLRAAHGATTFDAGTPFRLTLSSSQALGKRFAIGGAWHHTFDDGPLDGLGTFDYGFSARPSNHLAIGGVVRDIFSPKIAGLAIERSYELEAVVRPTGTTALELAVGGRIGQDSRDVDGWARISGRLARGVSALASVESRAVHRTDDLGVAANGRELRATLGLEVSFGNAGATMLATGVRDDRGERHPLGGQLVLRVASQGTPSVLGRADHIERLELSGELELRDTTALVRRLRSIAGDPSAVAVVLELDRVDAGIGTLQELRDEILALRRAGKRVFAHAVVATQREYFLASAADKVYLDPAGELELVGLAGTAYYYRGALDQLGITPQFEKIAEYKSAPETYTETKATPSASRMNNELVDGIWDAYVAQVAASRKLSPAELRGLVDKGPYAASELAGGRLVDGLVTSAKLEETVRSELGKDLPIARATSERRETWHRPQVAVIYVSGEIARGPSRAPLPIPLLGAGVAGSDTLVAAIKAAREDDSVGAIVLRIDSPGGDATASELISREVFATRGQKPIVCSIRDVAASGGYFIAAGCERIFAEPMSITGSIGVYYGKFDYSGLYSKLGVSVETYQRGKHAALESRSRAWTADERAFLQDKMRLFYNRFVGAVAEGRKLATETVDTIGRGHVYTASQALPIKLVDEFGGLNAAVDEAARRMHVAPGAPLDLVELPRVDTNPLAALAGGGQVQVHSRDLEELVGALAPLLDPLLGALPAAHVGMQARLPYEVLIR